MKTRDGETRVAYSCKLPDVVLAETDAQAAQEAVSF